MSSSSTNPGNCILHRSVALRLTADHGACRDRKSHLMPAAIILGPVNPVLVLSGSIAIAPI
jgi:hypothetical protein